ncbi:MAG: Three-Cys-motif partner protein [Gemmatimonadetes bacterium]|nr:Three-Cys-motif partner protein [Gemmatimonadota bacterium]
MEEDGHYRPEIKAHSLEKIRRHNFYSALFSKSMRKKWANRVYIGLYAGAGRALIQPGSELVETSAVSVFRQEVPFTKYIFVDSDRRCIDALRARIDAIPAAFDVTLIHKEVNCAVPDIVRAMPRFSPATGEGMISLCFVDPFRVDLNFEVIRQLSRYTMDFLVMLPLGYDLRRNLRHYLTADVDNRVAALIDSPNWREEWRKSREPDRHFVRFILKKFDKKMETLGYRQRKWEDTVTVKVTGMGVYLYSLAFYSKHELGEQFWKTTIAGTEPQYDLGL